MKKLFDVETVNYVAKLSGLSPILNIALAGLIASILYTMVPSTELLTWSGAIIIIGILRILQQTSLISSRISPWMMSRYAIVLIVLQAVVWGMAIVYFSETLPSRYELFLIFIAGGIIAAAVPFLSPQV